MNRPRFWVYRSGRSGAGGNRYDADGAEGLYDRRLGKVSARRVPVDTVIEVLDLFDIRHFDFTARHFWDKLVSQHGFGRRYNWVRLTLRADGRTAKAPRRGVHRRKRPRRPCPVRCRTRMVRPMSGCRGSGGI